MTKFARHALLALSLLVGCVSALAAPPPPVPALPDTTRVTTYTPTASAGPFNVNFDVYGDSTDYGTWLEVWVNGVKQTAVSGWTLSSATGPIATIPRPITDAQVTLATPATGTVQIVGARRPRRVSQFPENRGVAARDFNQVLTDLTAQNRELWDFVQNRTVKAPPGSALGYLPAFSNCQGKFIGFDVTGLIPICLPGGPGSGNVVGPVSSVANQLALFNSTDGTQIKALGSLGTANQVLHGGVLPSFGPVDLAADVTGTVQSGNFPALTGDVTTPGASLSTTITNNAVTNAKLAQAPANTTKCNPTGVAANPTDCTPTQVMTALCSSPTVGAVLYYTGTQFVCGKLAFVTPEMYGAVANNSGFNSTTAITNAVNSGFEVRFQAGAYYVTSVVVTTQNPKMVGAFAGTIIYGTTATDNIISLGNGSATFYNLDMQRITLWTTIKRTAGAAIFGRKVYNAKFNQVRIGGSELFTAAGGDAGTPYVFPQPGNLLFNGLVLNEFAIVTFKQSVVWGASNDCITVYGNSSNTFGVGFFTDPDTFVSNCGRDGVVVSGGTGGVNLNLNVSLNGRYGVRVDTVLGGANNREIFFGPDFASDSNVSDGVFFDTNSTFLSNWSGAWSSGNRGRGVYIAPTQISTSGGANFIFSNPIIYSNRGAGLHDAGQGSNTTISGGISILNGSTASGATAGANGVFFDSKGSGSVTMTGMRVDGNGQAGVGYGLAMTGGYPDVTITGNKFSNNAQSPCTFALSGSFNQIIRNNGGCMYGTPYSEPQGRMTPLSGTPVLNSSVAGATTMYYTPYKGNQGLVIDAEAANYPVNVLFAECSQALSDTTRSPAAAAANKVYDFFTWTLPATGAFVCSRGPAWTSDTVRGYTISRDPFGGVDVNASAITNGPAAGKGVWVGMFRTNAAGTVDYTFGSSASGGGAAVLSVWNRYNRQLVRTTVTDSTTSWTYSTATARPLNNSTSNRVSFVQGNTDDQINVQSMETINLVSAAGAFARSGFALNATNVLDKQGSVTSAAANAIVATLSPRNTYSGQLGFNFVQATEIGDGTNSNVFFGGVNQGLSVEIMQ